jgi:hypothetical protein
VYEINFTLLQLAFELANKVQAGTVQVADRSMTNIVHRKTVALEPILIRCNAMSRMNSLEFLVYWDLVNLLVSDRGIYTS